MFSSLTHIFYLCHVLKEHLEIHGGEKPNKCNQCNYASASVNSLKIHLRTYGREKPNKYRLCITSSQHISTPQIWHISTPQKGTSPPPKEHISTPQKDSFHTPTEIFSKDENDKIKSESECVCSSGSCGGLGGGPHRAEPDHVQRQTGVRSRWRSTTFWRSMPLPWRTWWWPT